MVLDILGNHAFIAVLADRAGTVPIAPKLPTSKLLFHLRTPLKHLPRRQALQHRHQLCHAVGWHGLHQKMHMVFVYANFHKLDLLALLDLQANFSQHLIDRLIEHCPPILRWKHPMVEQNRYVMTFVDVLRSSLHFMPQSGGELTLGE